MIKVEAIVREEALEDVKEALIAQDIRGITVSQVMGCGTQMGYTQMVRGSKVSATITLAAMLERSVLMSFLIRVLSPFP